MPFRLRKQSRGVDQKLILSGRSVLAVSTLGGAGVVAVVARGAETVARWIAVGVLIAGLTLLLRAQAMDPPAHADGAGFAACLLSAGVAAPFLLGFIGVLLAVVLVPASTGSFALHWVRAGRCSTAIAAWICGAAVTPLASWIGGRADERPAEAVAASLLLIAVAGALVWIRRFERRSDRPSSSSELGTDDFQVQRELKMPTSSRTDRDESSDCGVPGDG